MERSLVLAKPDAIQRGLIGDIVNRFEKKGLKLIAMKMMQLDDALLQAHYAHIVDKPFYKDTEKFMKSSPVIAMVWEGVECIDAIRLLVGSTAGKEADAGTIRGDLSIGNGRNIIHASDSVKAAEEEIDRFFDKDDLFSYDKTEYQHVYNEEDLTK